MTEIIEGQLVLPDATRLGQLRIKDGQIASIEFERTGFVRPDITVPADRFISPGFIDLQVNGAFGKEFKSDTDAMNVVTGGLPRFGTTSICPTVTTRELSSYPEHLSRLLANYLPGRGTKFLGFHLEGPFLNPKKIGAQNPDILRTPSQCQYSEYVTEAVRIVTLSPELEGAPDFIRSLLADGRRVGVGHSTVSFDELTAVFDPERMMIVHIFNAMDGVRARDPSLATAGLVRSEYFVSLIADGIHVDPAVVRLVWKCKEDKRKLICITDGSAVSGLPEGVHLIGTRRIQKLPDRAVLEGTTTLVGSILTQNIAAKNLREFTQCTISEAVNTVSLNPAAFLGLEGRIGQIKIGAAADLTVFDKNFEVYNTIINGRLIWSRGD